jgi:hypothetical protein
MAFGIPTLRASPKEQFFRSIGQAIFTLLTSDIALYIVYSARHSLIAYVPKNSGSAQGNVTVDEDMPRRREEQLLLVTRGSLIRRDTWYAFTLLACISHRHHLLSETFHSPDAVQSSRVPFVENQRDSHFLLAPFHECVTPHSLTIP